MPHDRERWDARGSALSIIGDTDWANGERGAVVRVHRHRFAISVDKENMTQPRPSRFTALVRWRSDAAPGIELETHHEHFRSAESAALAANGLGWDAFDELVVERGTATLRRDGIAQIAHCTRIVVWVEVSGVAAGVPSDWAFERIEGALEDVCAADRPEHFRPHTFRVIDDHGEDVAVEFLRQRGITVVIARPAARTGRSDIYIT